MPAVDHSSAIAVAALPDEVYQTLAQVIAKRKTQMLTWLTMSYPIISMCLQSKQAL